MNLRRKVLTAVLVFCAAVGAYGAKGTPLMASFSPISSSGVTNDSTSPLYVNGENNVQVYFGAGGKDVDLVTYNTGRRLHFVFNTASPAWQASGLTGTGDWEVDFYGINFYGRFTSMGVGTTAQLNGVLQWHVPANPNTYELDYQSLAVMRTSTTTWHVTSNPLDIPGFPGFTASDQAALGSFRRKTKTSYGAVNMPIAFDVTLQ